MFYHSRQRANRSDMFAFFCNALFLCIWRYMYSPTHIHTHTHAHSITASLSPYVFSFIIIHWSCRTRVADCAWRGEFRARRRHWKTRTLVDTKGEWSLQWKSLSVDRRNYYLTAQKIVAARWRWYIRNVPAPVQSCYQLLLYICYRR